MPRNNASRQVQNFVRDITLNMYLYHQVIFQHHRGDEEGELDILWQLYEELDIGTSVQGNKDRSHKTLGDKLQVLPHV